MTTRQPRPQDSAPQQTVRLRRHSWDPDTTMEVQLRPRAFGRDVEWEVYDLDGTWLGTIGKYPGSLDRKAGRLRIPGKQRTLWHANRTSDGSRPLYEKLSRADAIRWLLP